MKPHLYNLSREILICLVVFYIISMPFIAKLDAESFDPDENAWIKSSNLFRLFFIEKDFQNKDWKQQFYDPPFFKYFIGLVLVINCNEHEIEQLNDKPLWNWKKDHEWNRSNGAFPPHRIHQILRLAVAIFGIFTCMLIYWIGRTLYGLMTGITASILLAYNPLMLSSSRKVMTDTPSLFFLTATIALMIIFFRYILLQKSAISLMLTVLVGMSVALSAGIKLSGGLSAIIFTAFCALMIFAKITQYNAGLKRYAEVKTIAFGLLITIIIALGLFVIMNPYLYDKPVKGLLRMLKDNANLSYLQQLDSSSSALMSLNEKIGSVVRRTLMPSNYVTLGKIFKIPLDFIFFVLGLSMLLRNEIKFYLKFHDFSANSIIIIWVVAVFVGISIWIPLDWPRYYLTIVPCVAIVSGFCLGKVIDRFYGIVKGILIKQRAGFYGL